MSDHASGDIRITKTRSKLEPLAKDIINPPFYLTVLDKISRKARVTRVRQHTNKLSPNRQTSCVGFDQKDSIYSTPLSLLGSLLELLEGGKYNSTQDMKSAKPKYMYQNGNNLENFSQKRKQTPLLDDTRLETWKRLDAKGDHSKLKGPRYSKNWTRGLEHD